MQSLPVHTMRFVMKQLTLLMLLVMPLTGHSDEMVMPETFTGQIKALATANHTEKEQLIAMLAVTEEEQVLAVFKTMLAGLLYVETGSERIVMAEASGDRYRIIDALDNSTLGVVDSDAIKKITVNNKLRGVLKIEIAKLSLLSKKSDIRLAAVNELISSPSETSVSLLREMQARENHAEVLTLINLGLAIADVSAADKSVRLQAISLLEQSLMPQAKQALESVLVKNSAGVYEEQDLEIVNSARKAVANIETWLQINSAAETVFFGISLGSVLLLSAIGLAITFGVMGVINMAHGELMMLGAYTTYMIQSMFPQWLDYSLFIAIPAAFIVSGLFGIAIERGVIRFLYGRPLETLLATFGVSLILQQLVRTTISAQNVIVSAPSWMSGSLQINPALSITYNRLYIIIFSLIVFGGLIYILKKSVLGLQVRAVSQNRDMARAMGVRSARVDALTFGLGSGIAGVAGVALSQLTNVGPNLGQSYIIDSFMVVVFGGVGNLWGTLVAAMSLGVINKFLEPVAGAVLAKILVLVFIILFIQKKPRGLFPQKGRSAEN